MSRIADRNLLWGVLALQVEFITRDALIDGMTAWSAAKDRDLEDILVERGALTSSRRDALAPLLALHVAEHGDDPARSLAALSSIGPAREAIMQVDDTDVRASLGRVGPDPYATNYEAGGKVDQPDTPTDARAPVRFRRLRPHARGNLGEVFVARDDELNRDVALKEIQEKHADREDSRRRFLVEAEITGGLEHPGIVPVYGLGRYPDGRPFYAMRFIKGDSLAEAIAAYHKVDPAGADPGERSVSLRKLLRRFTDVCNAVAYAHSRGVLHRDLKPGNIMVGKYGETLVVDWGLARTLGDDHPDPSAHSDEPALSPISGSGLPGTVAGTAVGTPAYMPPEQAEGRLDLLGIRSDVYSLGATLYHLLTGRAPFDRGEVADVLRRVIRGDFPPPRAVAPLVPKGLEAICLKAMATRPEDRYPTALALAADLDHWLADEPTEALPDRLLDRLARWSRRHRAATLATAGTLLSLTLAATTAVILIAEAQRGTQKALDAQRIATREREAALADRTEALAAQMRATAEKQAALSAETRAKERMRVVFGKARKTVEDLVALVRDDRQLRESPALRPFRTNLLERAMAFTRGFVKDYEGEPDLRAEVADAYHQLAHVIAVVGRPIDAEPAHRKSLMAYEALIAEQPESAEHREGLAAICNCLGILQAGTGRLSEAERSYVRARDLREKLVADQPDLDAYREGLAEICTNLGVLQQNMGRFAEAEGNYRRASGFRGLLVADRPGHKTYREGLAKTSANLGVLLQNAGRFVEAESSYGRAREQFERLVADQPDHDEYPAGLAAICNNIGALQKATGRPAEAERSYIRAREQYERLVAERPEHVDYRDDLAMTCTNLGTLQAKTGRAEEAERSYRRACELRERVVAQQPERPAYRIGLGLSLGGLGDALEARGAYEEGRRSFLAAVGHQRAAFDREPRNPFYRSCLDYSLSGLARIERQLGHHAEAAAATARRRDLQIEDPSELYNAACEFALCVPLAPAGSADRTRYGNLAIGALREAVAAGCAEFLHAGADPDLAPLRGRADFRAMLLAMMDRAMPADPFAATNRGR